MKLLAKLSGKTSRYSGNGRQFGYPTANIAARTKLKDGVYFGFADLAGYISQPALIFIGVPETVGDSDRRVEAYLLDIPDRDYYDQALALDVRQFHRPNQKFSSLNELKHAMRNDELAARKWLDNRLS